MKNSLNRQWLILLLLQIGVGVFLHLRGDADSALLFFGSAFGQTVTGGIKATRSPRL